MKEFLTSSMVGNTCEEFSKQAEALVMREGVAVAEVEAEAVEVVVEEEEIEEKVVISVAVVVVVVVTVEDTGVVTEADTEADILIIGIMEKTMTTAGERSNGKGFPQQQRSLVSIA